MRAHSRRYALVLPVLALAGMGMTGCAERVQGSGELNSASGIPGEVAEFNLDIRLDEDGGRLDGSYEDPNYGGLPVSIRFDGLEVAAPGQLCISASGTYFQHLSGVSGSSRGGSGNVDVAACDGGEDVEDPVGDRISIQLTSGPLAGYSNDSDVIKGQLRSDQADED